MHTSPLFAGVTHEGRPTGALDLFETQSLTLVEGIVETINGVLTYAAMPQAE